MCDIWNEDIILQIMLLPLKVIYNENPNIFRTCSLNILSYEDMQSLLRAYLHGNKEVPYDIIACFFKNIIRQSTLRELGQGLNCSIKLNPIHIYGKYI